MTEAHTGRLLAASLHQAIGDLLPMRLEFYEVWLRSQGLRDGSIGAGRMSAVLGFLRTEAKYPEIVAYAGRLAAQWTIESMTPMRRRWVARLPRHLRARALLSVTAGIVRHTYSTSGTSTRIRRGHGQLMITHSIFCTVRDVQKKPMCAFYSSAVVAVLGMFDLPARTAIERCLAVDGSACVISVELGEVGLPTLASDE